MGDDTRELCARIFAVIDVQGRGSISRDQIVLALRMLNYNPVDSEVDHLLENGTGNRRLEYNYEQFLALVTKKIRVPPVEQQKIDLRHALATFDKENTGMIDKELFIAILTQLGEMRISEKEAKSWTEVLDRHKDGKLRINELEELFTSDGDIQIALNGQKWDLV